MKYSLNWVQNFTDLPKDLEPFLDKMAIDGFETEGIERFELDPDIVVARIDKIKKHPDADKLSLCEVYVGLNQFQVICGAKNIYPDMLVALAQIGSKLPDGNKIKKSKIRGVVSEGMLCSASELSLAENSLGILDLNKDIIKPNQEIKEGLSISDILNFPQVVVDFNITPDRGYALSHFALAQEIAILNQQKCKKPTQQPVEITDLNTQLSPIVKDEAKKACPKYLLRSIKGVQLDKPTPVFITNQLIQSSINCINPVVDILNYVMIEYGQPMHAFDADKIEGNINVCYADTKNQTIELINHDRVEIKKGSLLICDEKKPVALAGVMGSLDTAVGSQSSNILLECAYFDSVAIAGKSRDYNLSSDAAYRYERGVDFNLPERAMERASELITQYLSGSASAIFTAKSEADLPKLQPITISFEKINRVLGLNLSNRAIVEMLSRICDVEYSEQEITMIPPSHRYDLRIEEDLIEEIVRIDGYQKIKSKQFKVISKQNLAPQFNPKRVREFFVDRGYSEVINYSFISPDLHQLVHPNINPIILDNPISKDKSIMRYSLFAGLIETYLQNKKYKNELNQFFEIGTCFSASQSNESSLFKESTEIAGLLSGNKFTRNWSNPNREVDFYDLKGDLEALFEIAGVTIKFEAQNQLFCLHPKQSAKLMLDEKIIGYAGFLNPEITKQLSFNESILVFEFLLDAIIAKPIMQFKNFSRFPLVKRDLSFLINPKTEAKAIYQLIDELRIKELISYQIFDLYQEKNNNQKSIGIELCFQSDKKTLTDQVVEKMLQNIVEKLTTDLSVKFRDI